MKNNKKHSQKRLQWSRYLMPPNMRTVIIDIYNYISTLIQEFLNDIALKNPTIVYVMFLEVHFSSGRPRNISKQFNISIQSKTSQLLRLLTPKISFELERYASSHITDFSLKYAPFELINIDIPIIPIDQNIISSANLYKHKIIEKDIPLNKLISSLFSNNKYITNSGSVIVFEGEQNGWFNYKYIDTSNINSTTFNFQQRIFNDVVQTKFYYISHHYKLDGNYLFTNYYYTPRYIKSTDIVPSRNTVKGIFDIETYIDSNGSHKVYNIGLVTFTEDIDFEFPDNTINSMIQITKHKANTKTFYLTNYSNEEALITDFIENLLKPRNNRELFYAHNLMGFDLVFLLKYLNRVAKCDIVERDGEIYSLDVRYGAGNQYVIYIRDSYKILPMSLKKLSEHFLQGVNINEEILNLKYTYEANTKDIFPYRFITEDLDLNYKGSVPEQSDFDNISINEYQTYISRFKKGKWSLKTESTKYMILDCVLLFLILLKYNKLIYEKYKINPVNNISISGLTYKIYQHNYLGEYKIPILTGNVYTNIRESYYGGICEVYKPYGTNLHYYDVNSLYPHSMLNIMPGGYYYKSTQSDLSQYFGFVKARVKAPYMRIPFLPVKFEHRLFLPYGEWTGWYFTEELKYAENLGYEIEVIEGYNFTKIEPFKEMILELYEIKKNSETVMRTISKLLLNNLYGRFGMRDDNTVTVLVGEEEYENILKNKEIAHTTEIDEDTYMVTYYQNFKSEKISRREIIEPNINVGIASAITGYSRIYMDKIKRKYENNIYYTDTDSIVMDVELQSDIVGGEIGQFKKEYDIKEGVFPNYKIYGIKDIDNNTVIKSKGLDSKKLTYEDLYKYYISGTLTQVTVKKHKSYIDSTIYEKNTELNIMKLADKRVKIYKDDKWIDSEPYYYDGKNIIRK